MENSKLKHSLLINICSVSLSCFVYSFSALAQDLQQSNVIFDFLDNVQNTTFNNKELEKTFSYSVAQNNNETSEIRQIESITQIKVEGNSIFTEEINQIIQSYKNQQITIEILNAIAEQISQLYINQGYITTRAVLSNISDNIAFIRVDEGLIETLEIEGAQELENYVRQRINFATKPPLNSNTLEDQLKLLKSDSLIETIEASLRPGTSERRNILTVKVSEANPFFGTIGIDNYSPPSVGATQMTLSAGHLNLFGFGDSLSFSYQPRLKDFFGTYSLDTVYRFPVNPMNGTVMVRVALQENTIIEQTFANLDIRGESQFYEISYRQPLIRNPRKEFALSLGMNYRNSQTFAGGLPLPFSIGPDSEGRSRTNVLILGQDYVTRDTRGAWRLGSQIRLGVGLFDVTTSQNTNDPDGYFVAWSGQVQRVKSLNPDNLLIVQGELQLSLDPLLPSEQFVIGGGQSVRGYRQNVRGGDNGFRFSIEDRITLVRNEDLFPTFQVAPFFDMGGVWNVSSNPNPQSDRKFIASFGMGFIWQPIPNLNMRLDYAPRLLNLVKIQDRSNNIQDDGLYFNLKYNL